MKTVRSLTTLVGLFVGLLVLGAAGAKGQILNTPRFTGAFTLPFEAQWGEMTLPAGDYTVKFGFLSNGHALVVVKGRTKGSPRGMILAGLRSDASAANSALLCIREGNGLIVRALEMPAIGESVTFQMPRGAQLAAHNGKNSGYTQLAEAPMLIQRIPVTLNAK